MTILKKLNSSVLKIWILSLCACACTDAAGKCIIYTAECVKCYELAKAILASARWKLLSVHNYIE